MRAHRLGVAFCVILAAGPVSGAGQRAISAGVYSAAQAARGEAFYRAKCGDCHGKAMDGAIGPPLVGEGFLANWSARPLAELVDKIQKTMPFEQPGSLSRQESTDLVAYLLRAGRFPGGSAELTDASLAGLVMPTVIAPAAPALPAPEGNLAELMRAIAFPNANIIFNLQLKNPSTAKRQPLAASPFDYVEWGATVYPGWLAVDQAAVALTEAASLLLTPGRRCQNGRPAPVDRPDWKAFVAALADVGRLAHLESRARHFEAFGDVSEKLNDACANCHKVYRDKGGSEGSGTARCQ